MNRSEQLRAAIIAVVQSLLPALVLLNVIDWTSDTIAAVMLVVTNITTLAFLLLPNAPATDNVVGKAP